MSLTILNAPPAEPTHDRNGDGELCLREWGKTLADYFAAHAPADPQPWFQPVLKPWPVAPKHSFTSEEDVNAFKNWLSDPCYDLDGTDHSPHLAPQCTAQRAYWDACVDADRERTRQRLVQWPYAWAEKQLLERERLQALGRQEAEARAAGGVA